MGSLGDESVDVPGGCPGRVPGWLAHVRITDVRSVWGPPLELPLGDLVTVLVGPNRAGTSNVAWALAAAVDPSIAFRPDRDLPRHSRAPDPRIELRRVDGERTVVRFDVGSGRPSVQGPQPAGVLVTSRVHETPRDLLRSLAARDVVDLDGQGERDALAGRIAEVARQVLPEVELVEIDRQLLVRVWDDLGSEVPVPETRAIAAIGTAVRVTELGIPVGAVVIEAPDAFLHPAAQEVLAALLRRTATRVGAPVVVTTTSPFAIPREPDVRVVALARDSAGRTAVVGSATGDETQARLLGGLLRDNGLAAVLDRVGRIPAGTRAVLIVEGGTDEAYLRRVAATLGRSDVLEDVELRPSGGAMGAVLAAVLLRAELDVPLLVLLDHDDPGRRARDTLVSRFGFERGRQIVTYADVFDGRPPGVEAETLFDVDLLRRFVREHGRSASRGERSLHGLAHVDLTSAGKSAFVGWLEDHLLPEHLDRWSDLLDVLEEALGQ